MSEDNEVALYGGTLVCLNLPSDLNFNLLSTELPLHARRKGHDGKKKLQLDIYTDSLRLFLQRKGRQSKIMVHLDTEPEGRGNPERTPEQDGGLCRDRALSPHDFRNPHGAAAHATRQFTQRKFHGDKEFIAQDFSRRVESRAERDAVFFHI